MTDTATFTFRPKHQRGVCKTCGAPAYTGQATSCAPNGKCVNNGDRITPADEAKVKTDVLSDAGPATSRIDRPAAAPSAAKPLDEKGKRAAALEAAIVNQVNPFMPVAMGYLCRPLSPDNFYQATAIDADGMPVDIQVTQLGAAAMFTPMEAKILGKCAAELESSPILTMVTGSLAPVMPVLYVVGAVGVVAFHGYRMMALRNQLLAQARVADQANDAANAAGVYAMPDPDGVDFVAGQTANATVAQPLFSESDVA